MAFNVVLIFCLLGTIAGNPAEAAGQKVNLKLTGGATYYGEVKNGKPHGKGTMNWGPNKRYAGDWVDGKRSGQGEYFFTKGDKQFTFVYKGAWKNDKKNGYGTYLHVEDSDYMLLAGKGQFVNDAFVSGNEVRKHLERYELVHMDDKTYTSAQVYTVDAVPPTEVAEAKKQIDQAVSVIGSAPGDVWKQHPTYTHLTKQKDGTYKGTLMRNDYLGFIIDNSVYQGTLTMDLLDVQREENNGLTLKGERDYISRNDTFYYATGQELFFQKDYGSLETGGYDTYVKGKRTDNELISSDAYETAMRKIATGTAPYIQPYTRDFAELLAYLAQNRYIHFQNKDEIPA